MAKNFFELFSKYTPSEYKADVIGRGKNMVVRTNRNPDRIEIELDFDAVVEQAVLYEIERDIRIAYGVASCKIFPHYPERLFNVHRMRDIVEEAASVGAITYGFFEEAKYVEDGELIIIKIPYRKEGIDLVNLSGAADIFSRIIESRFGIKRTIEIKPTEDAEQRSQDRENSMLQMENAYAAELAAFNSSADSSANLEARVSVFENTGEVEKTDEFVYKIGHKAFDTENAELIFGPAFAIVEPTPLSNATREGADVTVLGEVFKIDERETKEGDKLRMTVSITDGVSSIALKKTFPIDDIGWYKDKKVKVGTAVAVRGKISRDRFDNELVLLPRHMYKISKKLREDTAQEKRVELHLHTNMSTMDAIIKPDELVSTALRWGHKAIAVTDHGNVQSFPEVMKAARKTDLKIIYGMEAYFVDDTARAIYGESRPAFDSEMVVFDLETTGLSASSCEIIEIGAVKIKNGEITDRFGTFVKPSVTISEEITNLTSITNEMVADAPEIADALRDFLAFVGDSMLIAHNAAFDIGFTRAAADRCGYAFNNTYLDTVSLSRYLNPDLNKHKLDVIAEHYGLGDFHHHRADEDAHMLALIFIKMLEQLKSEGITTFDEMISAMSETADPLKLRPRHMILLCKDNVGLKNLYRLISESYLSYYRRVPRIPKTLLSAYREGLIVGSACEAGELYQAILENASRERLEEIASYYDYLEIQPLCNNMFLVDEGKVASVDALKDINKKIIELGKRLGKPTVATCDAHFLEKEDEIYRKILLKGQKFADGDRDTGIYLRTTEEMLTEFSYLGEELAHEVVIDNPNKIADTVEKILPIPDGTYTPSIPGAEEELQQLCWDRARDWYGDDLPDIVRERLEIELKSIVDNGFAVLYMIAQKLVAKSESLGYLVGSRGSVGSSFVATMSGISEVNPLPPHYRCLKCKHSEFITDGSVGSGFDLEDKNCPVCGEPMYCDGHDIPFATFLGFNGDKSPDIDLNFSGDVQGKIHKYTEELFGEGHVFRAGTIGTLADKTAFGYVMKYLEEKGISLPKAEVEHLVHGCAGVKKLTGQHPGGVIVVPTEYDIYDFTPVQHPADDPHSDIITTHFQFSYLHDTILKLDELGHDIPTKYKMLEKYTNTSVLDVKMNDPAVYSLFLSTEKLGVKPEEIGSTLGTYGIPEFGTRFAIRMVEEAKPQCFADLLQISGLSHGTNVWTGNAQDLIREGICNISQVIGCRDNIMNDLIRYGLDRLLSFKIMESVRKGKGLTPEWVEEMKKHGVPDWYIDSCKKIKYMFPKAHAAAYVMSAIRLGWYKIYYPMEFYAAFLSVAPGGFDSTVVGKGKGEVERRIKEIEDKGNDASAKEAEEYSTLLMVREAMARGIQFLPVDLYKSDAFAFLPENGRIRMPFSSLGGLGDTAAQNIVAAREEHEIYTVEDLRKRAKLNKSVIEIMRENGVLDNLSETDQFSFF